MSNELMELPVLTPEQSHAWLSMASAKNDVVAELTQAELNAQSMLIVKGDDYKDIDAALANYRKAYTAMVELRKEFTNQIDAGIIQPLMAFEKRVDPKANETYKGLESTSLSLRKAEADKVAQVNQINAEIAQFKAHCSNEYFKAAAEYRQSIRAEINNQYKHWLQEKVCPDLDLLAKGLELIELPLITKFKATLITQEQMIEAHNGMHQPNWKAIFDEMVEEMRSTFANFNSDLSNVSAAIEKQQEATQLATIAEQNQVIEESAINTLIATSEAVVIAEPQIKRTYSILVVESEAWAKSVIAGFIANLPALTKYIRVKSWSKLSIGQMAEYLAKLATDNEVKVQSLEYKEVEK